MRITNPVMVNTIREHAERTGQDERAVVIVQGRSHMSPGNIADHERDLTYIRNAPLGSGDRPSPLGCVAQPTDFKDGVAPAPGYYWVDVDGEMVDKTEEFGLPDPAIDGWAGFWRC